MARVSRIPLDKAAYRHILDTLDLVLGKLKREEVRSFLFSLLGKNERIMVAKRFTTIVLLKRGFRVKDISESLKMTESTIRKLAMVMHIKNEGFDLAYKKIAQDKMRKEVNKILIGLAKGTAEVFMTHRIKPPNDYPGKRR